MSKKTYTVGNVVDAMEGFFGRELTHAEHDMVRFILLTGNPEWGWMFQYGDIQFKRLVEEKKKEALAKIQKMTDTINGKTEEVQ